MAAAGSLSTAGRGVGVCACTGRPDNIRRASTAAARLMLNRTFCIPTTPHLTEHGPRQISCDTGRDHPPSAAVLVPNSGNIARMTNAKAKAIVSPTAGCHNPFPRKSRLGLPAFLLLPERWGFDGQERHSLILWPSHANIQVASGYLQLFTERQCVAGRPVRGQEARRGVGGPGCKRLSSAAGCKSPPRKLSLFHPPSAMVSATRKQPSKTMEPAVIHGRYPTRCPNA